MINWGVIGLGRMGSTFSNAIKETSNSKLILTASHSNKKIDLIESSTYDNLINRKNIDAIYISTLNNTHTDLIIKSINSGKNVLCEKPLSTNLDETIKIEKILNDTKVNLFEAVAYYSHPQTINLINLVKEEVIGKINYIESSFGFKTKIRPDSRLFNKELGGGAILDLGCYPISFLMLFCDDYNLYTFESKKLEHCETNVENDAEAKLILNNSIKAKIKVSFKTHLKNNCTLYGEKGKITISEPWLPQKKSYIEIETHDHYYKKFIHCDLSVFANQINNVSDFLLNKKKSINNLFDIKKSITCMKLLETWKKN